MPVLHRVLEVERVDVELVRRHDADLFFLVLNGGKRTAREVVADSAIAHRRPVADVGGMESRGGAIALDELLDGLHSVEEALRSRPDDDEGGRRGSDDVPLGLHFAGEFRDGMVGQAGEFNTEATGCHGGDVAGLEGRGEVAGCEAVF